MKKYEVVEFEAGDVIQFIGFDIENREYPNGQVVVLLRSLGVFRLLGGGYKDTKHVTNAQLQELYSQGRIDYIGNLANQKGVE